MMPGVQRQLGDAVGDDVEIGRRLHVLGEQLEEAGVVDAVVVVVPGVHVEGRLGHRPRADVEHVGQALADRRVERLVHVGDALPGGEVRGAQAGHRKARGDRGGGVLALGLDEDQRPAGDVDVSGGCGFRPVFAHLGRGRDRVGAGGVARLALALDDRGVAVHRSARPGVFEIAALLGEALGQLFDRCLGHLHHRHRVLPSGAVISSGNRKLAVREVIGILRSGDRAARPGEGPCARRRPSPGRISGRARRSLRSGNAGSVPG